MKKLTTILTVSVFMIGCASTKNPNQTAAAALDYDSFSSQLRTTKAWNALDEGIYMRAIKYTEKCKDLYPTGSGRSSCH